MSKRHTVSIRHNTYEQLYHHGKFGESFSDLLSRILDGYERQGQQGRTIDKNGGE